MPQTALLACSRLLPNRSVKYAESLVLHFNSPTAKPGAIPNRKPQPLDEALEVCVGAVEFVARTSLAK